MSLANVPVAPFLFLGLLFLPVRLSPPALRRLAFALWLTGGLFMVARGASRFHAARPVTPAPVWYGAVLGAVVLGWAKGRFVLSRTSQRNLRRLQAIDAPRRAVQVYPARSWALIALFVVAGMALGWVGAPPVWRGAVSVAVGLGLVFSSFAYVRA